ncbi:recombinase family protein [Clostridium sp. C8-1-8]|uniref:recombinase family protein n=1 Tax=Clostridium sp. C8-1-8 TaxID=2698831 RepID=UPI00136A314E
MQVNVKRFLGYVKNEEGKLVINPKEAEIVKRIYREYLNGSSLNEIKRGLERDKIKTVTDKEVWQGSTIKGILSNEKYYGNAVLQKTITVDYLTHKRKKNQGESPKYEVKV